MSKWCLNHKKDMDDFLFHPDAPEKALCKECIKNRIRDRNKEVFDSADRREREQEAVRAIVRQFQTDHEPYIYLIEHENKYKIGFSRDINKRIKNFNTSHAIPCKIIAVAPGDKSLEKELHIKFSLHHIKGEWFLKKPSMINAFKGLNGVLIFLPGYLKQESSPPSC